MSTSGSTGTPLAMVQDHNKALCNTADSIFLGTLGRYHIGEKMAFIRVWVNNVRKGKVQLMMENSIMMDSASLSDDAISGMLDILKKQKVKCLIGYSSALGEISEYIRRSETDMSGFSVHSILPISEAMPAFSSTSFAREKNRAVSLLDNAPSVLELRIVKVNMLQFVGHVHLSTMGKLTTCHT